MILKRINIFVRFYTVFKLCFFSKLIFSVKNILKFLLLCSSSMFTSLMLISAIFISSRQTRYIWIRSASAHLSGSLYPYTGHLILTEFVPQEQSKQKLWYYRWISSEWNLEKEDRISLRIEAHFNKLLSFLILLVMRHGLEAINLKFQLPSSPSP